MSYLRSISRISDVSDGVIDELTKILDKVVGLKNEAVVPKPSATCPPSQEKPVKFQEGPRESPLLRPLNLHRVHWPRWRPD